MAHDRHNCWPRFKLNLLSLHDGIQQLFSRLFRPHIDLDPVLLRNHHGSIHVHRLIKREHLTHIHQFAHDVGWALPDQFGKFLYRHARHKLEALSPWLSHLPRRAVMHMLATVVTTLLYGNGAKVLPASRILMKSELFFFPRTARFTNFLGLLSQTLGLHL